MVAMYAHCQAQLNQIWQHTALFFPYLYFSDGDLEIYSPPVQILPHEITLVTAPS